jgi:hypothetical protein
MATNAYNQNPALRPTVLVSTVMTKVDRPAPRPTTPREVPQVRQDATAPVARTTTRAA